VGVSDPPPIPFTNWAPIPRRIFRDVAVGRLTPAEGRVEKALYAAASPWTWTATFRDLDALARSLGWEFTTNYLSKVLASLRAKGRIDFETAPGRTNHGYEIRPLYQSEHNPSRNAAPSPSSEQPANALVEPESGLRRARQSEHGEGLAADASPSTGTPSPSGERRANPVVEPDSAGSERDPVRAARESLKPKTLTEEEGVDHPVGKGPEEPVENEEIVRTTAAIIASLNRYGDRPPVSVDEDGEWIFRNEPTDGEPGFLADCQALVDASLAIWLEDEPDRR
jgi:hypothetical protein